MWKFTQRAFTGGRLDAELMGRQDLAQYYKGASELMNLVVRRQGHLSKRRGTDFVCDLDGLLGYSIDGATGERAANAIGECRIFPLVHEREKGFYILMTAGRAFLCSKDGVRLMDGSWARKIEEYELAEYEGEVEGEGDKRPFYVEVPYSDDEIMDLDFCQSGDTVFLAHKNHPPAKIVFTGGSIAYSFIDFVAQKWARPSILSVTKSNVDGGGGSRNISYVCTYVKDGIESQPSEPFQMTFTAPWKSGGVVTIKCSKGDNATEPDYYNVYKKEYSEFGLISTIGALKNLTPSPKVTTASGGAVSSVARGTYSGIADPYRGGSTSGSNAGLPVSSFINTHPTTSLVREKWSMSVGGGIALLKGYGGVAAAGGVKFDFGDQSGMIISKFTMSLDAYVCASTWNSGQEITANILHRQAGVRFRIRVYASETGSTSQKVAVDQYVSVALCGTAGTEHNHKVGEYYWALDPLKIISSGADFLKVVRESRMLELDFAEKLKSAFSGKTQGFQVNSIVIEPVNDSNAVTGTMYFCGITFSSSIASSDTLQDEYVTPDLSLTPPAEGNQFKGMGDYPSCVGIYKQRLAFASTDNDPFMFWLSCVGDLYNFNTHASIREDDAISATLAATEFPKINHIIVNRDLMLLADSGEWKVAPVSGNTLSYKTVSADMQSAIGCAKSLKPISVGDEIVFVKRTGETLLATRYNFTSDGYESMDLSVLSQWIFRNNPIVQMAYRQHPDSTIECVLADGTMASLVYMKEHEVCAWSRHELGGGWKARGVATSKAMSRGSTEVMIVVERGGKYELWAMRDDVPVRNSAPAAADHLCMDGVRELAEHSSAISTGDESSGSADSAGDEGMVVVQVGGKRYAGYLYKAQFATVRPEPQGGETIQFEVKNAKDAEVRVLDSGDFRVRAYGVPEDMATKVATGAKMAEDGSAALATGDFKRVLAGCNNGDGRVVVESETPYPLNILSISVNYEIQPLSGSAG